ncbi:voltage-gated potassium channel [Stipitochalara longipes BDJ]|nr:voltage-gated potassium channel [Stipitochalara longipes BDJ]
MGRRSSSFSGLRGRLWATGKTSEGSEDPLKRAEEAMGKEWFAVTAFPLFAGTFGTIASALNVCALVGPWRCVVIHGSYDILHYINDPAWLIGINVCSIFFGVIANLALLPVLGDGSSSLAKIGLTGLHLVWISIAGGFLASFILIALVVATAVDLQLPSPTTRTFTQAYYFATIAAVLYFVTSAFIVYTAHMLRRSQQTKEQIRRQFAQGHRGLKLLTMLFMGYLLIGALVFSKIEGWGYLDALFWADVTILTVGFGDFTPKTHLGRSLLFPYATFGVFILFLVIYAITSVVFERGKSTLEVRLRDKDRIRHVQKRDQDRSAESTQAKPDNTTPGSRESLANEEREARRRDFNTMNQIILRAARKRILYSMSLWFFFAFFLWLVGALVFYRAEKDQGWTYFEAVYFTYISLLAIGYGDVTLQSMFGKAFFVLWSLIVVPTLTMLISTGTEAVGIPYLTGLKQWYRGKFHSQPQESTKHLSAGLVPIEQLPNNIHDKNHLLVQAIKRVAIDHIKNQENNRQKDYTFDDWEYIFYLMGVLEPSSDERNVNNAEDGNAEEKGSPKLQRTGLGEWTDGGQILDWLHGKNPLNVTETLTEWVLLTLVEKLEAELLELRKELGNTANL